jgi:RND family efflux transporter MFP subunit
MTEEHAIASGSRPPGNRLKRIAGAGLTTMAFVGVMGLGVGVLHHRSNAMPLPAANPPVTVATRRLALVDGHQVEESFTGRLEPGRQTRVAFERGGLVTRVLHDEGDMVAAGELLARLDTAQLESHRQLLEAQRRELEAQLALARAVLARQESLKDKGWSSRQTFDESRFQVAQLEAGIERVDALLVANRIDLDKSELRAPFSGTITARVADEGAVVASGAAIIELYENDDPRVRIGVSVDAARMLTVSEHYPLRAGGMPLTGRLTALRPDLQTGTQTVTAIFRVREGQTVPFGNLVELILRRHVRARGAWLPLAALSEGRKGLWSVFTVVDGEGGPVVGREAVEVIHVSGNSVFARGTFADGARIVTKGNNRIVSGQRVSVAAGS